MFPAELTQWMVPKCSGFILSCDALRCLGMPLGGMMLCNKKQQAMNMHGGSS